MPNFEILTNNVTNSTLGDDTHIEVTIMPYFPVQKFDMSIAAYGSTGRSWLSPCWGEYGHSRNSGARSHAGCDIYAPEGEPVYAVKSGSIISVETKNYPSCPRIKK